MNKRKIPFIGLLPLYLLFFSVLLFYSRDYTQAVQSPINLANINRIIGILSSSFLIIYFLIKMGSIKINNIIFKIYFIYILISFFSILLFSSHFLYDFWKLFEIFTVVLFGIYILTLNAYYDNVKNILLEKTFLFIKFLLFAVVLSMILEPSLAFEYMKDAHGALFPFRVKGTIIVINALSVGTLSAILLYYYFNKIFCEKKKLFFLEWLWILISFTLLILSQSRTSFFSLIVLILIYFIFLYKTNVKFKIFLFVILSAIVYISIPFLIDFFQRGASEKNIATLSGRTIWWTYAWNEFMNSDFLHKLVGFGFASGVRKMAYIVSGGFMNTLDSTYFSTLISSGFLGLFFIGLIYFTLMYVFYKKTKKADAYNICIYSLTFGIVFLIFAKSFTTDTINVLTYYVIILIIISIFINNDTGKINV